MVITDQGNTTSLGPRAARVGRNKRQMFLDTRRTHQEVTMNTDQIKGAAKDAAGKVQEAAGKLVDSKDQQAKGLAKQAEGSVQKGYGDAKETIKDVSNDLKKR
jgi:uncharacterized protein YjbJ (UPF0337 family)